jgi:streptogramin lyase
MIRLVASALFLLLTAAPIASASGFSPGDILVALANGTVEVRSPDGTLKSIMSGPLTGEAKGMAIAANGDLLVAYQWTADHSNGNTVGVYRPDGSFAGTFGGTVNCQPLAVFVDRVGNVYVSESQCLGRILKFDSSGTLLQRFYVNSDYIGAWWMDMAPDGCTLFYTSSGRNIERYDVCADTQLPNFNSAPLPGTQFSGALGLRILPDGTVLLADRQDIKRLDSSGNVFAVYPPSPQYGFAALTADPDGQTFWVTDTARSLLLRLDIAQGTTSALFHTTAAPKGVVVVPFPSCTRPFRYN